MFTNLNINEIMVQIAISIVPFMFAVTIHEVMHGYVAYKLGDYTAKNAGRLTLNPLVHIDPLGLIVLLLTKMIGWAKPVPVNYYNLNHKHGVALVSIAGPLANLVTAFLSALLLKILTISIIYFNISSVIAYPLQAMAYYSIMINIALCIFNLLPIMPMDGARIIWDFLPPDKAEKYEATQKYYFIIIFALIITNALHYITFPLRNILLTFMLAIFNINL